MPEAEVEHEVLSPIPEVAHQLEVAPLVAVDSGDCTLRPRRDKDDDVYDNLPPKPQLQWKRKRRPSLRRLRLLTQLLPALRQMPQHFDLNLLSCGKPSSTLSSSRSKRRRNHLFCNNNTGSLTLIPCRACEWC
jgi:hypothetical protein